MSIKKTIYNNSSINSELILKLMLKEKRFLIKYEKVNFKKPVSQNKKNKIPTLTKGCSEIMPKPLKKRNTVPRVEKDKNKWRN